MSLWFSELHTPNVKLSFKIKQQLFAKESDYQRIEIFDTYDCGKMLVLDEQVMLTEKDEFIYHEMLTHVPLAVNPDIETVLVIGGGDGGILRELSRYPQIKHLELVELDEQVVKACQKYLPKTACGFADPRVKLIYADGLRYVRTKTNAYDLIVVDSTDPFGPSESLFTREFYGNCYNALTEKGILVNQHESPYYIRNRNEVSKIRRKMQAVFENNYLYQAHIPSYPSGHWLYGFSSKCLHPIKDLQAERWLKLGLKTDYYNLKLHQGAFALPNYVLELLRD